MEQSRNEARKEIPKYQKNKQRNEEVEEEGNHQRKKKWRNQEMEEGRKVKQEKIAIQNCFRKEQIGVDQENMAQGRYVVAVDENRALQKHVGVDFQDSAEVDDFVTAEQHNVTGDHFNHKITNTVTMKMMMTMTCCLFQSSRILRRSEEKRIEAFEMWIWRIMECVKWTDRIRNEAVLERVNEERMMLKLIRKRKRNWLGHWLRRNCLQKDELEGMVNERNSGGPINNFSTSIFRDRLFCPLHYSLNNPEPFKEDIIQEFNQTYNKSVAVPIIASGIPLPPQPILNRWGTWLDAVNYYAEHYGKIMEVIVALDSTDSSAVAAVKSLPSEQLLEDILFIDSNFKIVSKNIILLE
ncbi:hypothetical protein ANN_23373 [Periplaneta americana]|uniref:Uncharacterized protein n=1 Tax=Periplaneta americana TaxID=6978 RepID=A0ABQ8SKZ4_PERAM|nr:hypothetical protein ANN_23373 [Periplaneta americana]